MRLLLVAALVAAAFAARDSLSWEQAENSENVDQVEHFRPGYEYLYQLEGQVASGLPVPGTEQSAVRSKSIVSLSFPEDTVAHLRVEKIRVASLQKELVEPKKIHPFELFDEIKLNEENLDVLRLPVRFRYIDGLVSDIEFDRADLPWSKNIKRTYINMLQVNIVLEKTPHSRDEEQESTYFFDEMTIEGDCGVLYTVLPTTPADSDLLLTKSIDFGRCSRRAGMKYNFRFAEYCPSCDKMYTREEKTALESSTVFNYRIRATPTRFVIKEVELRSVYSFVPMSPEETLFSTFVSGNLRLIDVLEQDKSPRSRIAAPKSEKKETLLHSMEWEKKEEKFMATGDESLLEDCPYPKIHNKPEVVVSLIKSILHHMETEKETVELVATHEMSRLVQILRLSTKEDLKRIFDEIYEVSRRETYANAKDLYYEALAVAGTFNTVEHLAEKIVAREMSTIRSSRVLKQLPTMRIPSVEIVDTIVDLCKELRDEPLQRQSCWLTAGALMHGVCGAHSDRLTHENSTVLPSKCPRDLKQRFVRELVEQYERAETRYEKVLALKTMANSGMDLIVFPLQKIIRDRTVEKTLRVQAIDALRKLRFNLPRKMVSILMPLYKNTREHPEIRVAAVNQLLQSNREKSVIHQVIAQLEKEPNTQVHSIVYDALTQLSRSEIPCEQRFADTIKASLRFARIQPRKPLLSSTFNRFTSYSEEHKAGASLNWGALFSNDSILPKEVTASLDTTFTGQWNKYLAQIGFSQNNIDQLLHRFIERASEVEGLEEVLIRGKRSTSVKPTEILRALQSKLNIVSRKQMEQDPHALVYMRFRDMDYAVIPIDQDVLPQIIKTITRNGRIELGEIEKILAHGYRFNTILSSFVYERTQTIVHSMGIPLVYTSKMPTIFKVDGVIKAEIAPKNGKSIDGLRLHLNARPALVSTHITEVESVNPIVSFGVKILHSAQVNVPVDVTTELKWEDKLEIKTTLALPKQSRQLVQLSIRPVSYMRLWPEKTHTYVEAKEKTIYVNELETFVRKIRSSHLEKALGVKLNVDGHVHGNIWDRQIERIPSALLIGENNLIVSFEKTEETPREFVMKTEISTFDEESRMARPDYDGFFEEDAEELHFKTEEYELFSEDEQERRDAFHEYVKSYNTGKAYSHRLYSEIKAVGGRKERKAHVEITSVCDEKMRYCKLNVNGKTTPLLEKETRDWTVDTEIELLYPEQPASLEELLSQKHRELSINVESRWGSNKKNELKLTIQGEQTKEQKRWMKRAAELIETKSLTPFEENSRLVEASQLNQFKLVAKYDVECPTTRSLVDKLYSICKVSAPFFKSSVEFSNNEERIVRAKLSFEPATHQFANLTIETPSEKFSVREYVLPFHLRLVNTHRQPTAPIHSLSHLRSSLLEETKSECTVESRKVRTFDDVIYRTPMTTCYSVLAKDCYAEEPKFAVLIKKISKNGAEKKMKIVSRESVIELEMDKRSEKLRVTIDGEVVKRVEELEQARVYKKNDLVVVELDDVTVEFDGFTARVKLSEYYKNKQCGMCGHFDGEKKTEFRRADNEETDDLEEFHRSFLVKDEECEVEERKLSEKRNYRVVESEEGSEEESLSEYKWETRAEKNEEEQNDKIKVLEPRKKTRVIEYSNRVCFSKIPVPECPRKSVENEENIEEIKVRFSCLSRSDREASRLLREARREVLDIDDLPESFVETIAVPRNCIVY